VLPSQRDPAPEDHVARTPGWLQLCSASDALAKAKPEGGYDVVAE